MRVILKPGAVMLLGVGVAVVFLLALLQIVRQKSTASVAPAQTGSGEPIPHPTAAPTIPADGNLVRSDVIPKPLPADGSRGRFTTYTTTGFSGSGDSKMRVVRCELAQPLPNAWDMQYSVRTLIPVMKGQRLSYSVWARSPTKSEATFTFEQATPPYRKALYKRVRLSPDWQEYRQTFACSDDHPVGDAAARVWVAHAPGVIETTAPVVTRVAGE